MTHPVRWPINGLAMTNWPLVRDVVLFFFGLGGVAYETVFTQVDRPTLLLLFAACMGLPVFLRTDERKQDGGKE